MLKVHARAFLALRYAVATLFLTVCACQTQVRQDVIAKSPLHHASSRGVLTAFPVSSAPILFSREGQLSALLDAVAVPPNYEPAFSYNGSPLSPTLELRPGDTLFITLHNGLPHASFTSNAVNLHFHGLQVSPNAPQDDVLTMLAKPGQTLHYEVHIPTTQQPGLYWYHPHSHGEAYWQVTSGMSGAIIVEGLTSRFPQLHHMRQRLLIVRDRQIVPDIMSIPWYARPGTISLEEAAQRKAGVKKPMLTDPDDAGPNRACAREPNLQLTIEGTGDGSVSISPGEHQLFGVLNASAGRVLNLVVDGEKLGLVAIDGYPIAAYPGTPHVAWLDHIVLPPGGRAEFIVTGQIHESDLRTQCYNSGTAGDRNPAEILARLVPSQDRKVKSSVIDADLGVLHYPAVMSPGAPVRTRHIILSEDASGFYINGQRFNMAQMRPMMTIRDGTLEKWVVENITDEVHAFHIHQVHFVVESINGSQEPLRLWRDTVLIPPQRYVGKKSVPSRIVLLVDFRSPFIKGEFPFHCHMLDHEDGGMMALVRVI